MGKRLTSILSFKVSDIGKSTADLIISDPEWDIFDKTGKNVPEPLSLLVKGSHPLKGASEGSSPAQIKIEYLSFETIDPSDADHNLQLHEFDYNEDYWITPSTCEALSDVKPTITVPKRLKMSVERIVEVEEGKVKSKEEKEDQTLKNDKYSRTKIVIDKVDDFKSYADVDNDTVKIYEGTHKLLFEITNGLFCKSYYQETPKMDSQLFKTLDDLADSPGDYLKVGTQMVRNILTDVFRKSEQVPSGGLEVTTLYLEQQQSDTNTDELTHDPVQITFEEFTVKGQIHSIQNSLQYNFFDFESIKNDNELERGLDLEQCIDESNVAFLSIVAKRGELRDIVLAVLLLN